MSKKKNPNIQPMPVWGPYGLHGHVKGDKIIIHKCELDKAVKYIKDLGYPSEDDSTYYQRMGAKYLVQDMLGMINRGNKEIKEKYGKG